MMAERIYDPDFYNDNSDLLGFDWGGNVIGPAIHGGIQALLGWGAAKKNEPKGCGISRLSDADEMQQCINQVMAAIDQLELQIGLVPPEQIIIQANDLAAVFSNHAYFDQNKTGRSGDIREAAKIAARQKVDALVQKIAGFQNAQIQPASAGTTTIDKNTLLIGGGLFLGLLLLTRS